MKKLDTQLLHRVRSLSFILFAVFLISSCQKSPVGVVPVKNFDLNNYLGKWYEIARLDHPFERGLNQVSAQYTLRKDGGVNVLNRGFNNKKNEWKTAKGKAYFVEDTKTGFLKVSFFGPFYGSYIIFELDPNYQYAFVSGPSHSYLWLLSRTPKPDKKIISKFMDKSKQLGFNTDKLIFPEH